MIEYDTQLNIQSWLDGELPESDARKIKDLVTRDQDAAALLNELRQTKQSLATFEAGIALPESADFYWSKIRRDIERLAPAEVQSVPVSFFAALSRLLVPASAVALVAIVGVIAALQSEGASGVGAETALADSGSFTYRDYASGTTLVWLSYPAENEVADNGGAASFD